MNRKDIEQFRRAAFDEAERIVRATGRLYELSGHFIERFNLRCPDQVKVLPYLVIAIKHVLKKNTYDRFSVYIDNHIFLIVSEEKYGKPRLAVVSYSPINHDNGVDHFANATQITLTKRLTSK